MVAALAANTKNLPDSLQSAVLRPYRSWQQQTKVLRLVATQFKLSGYLLDMQRPVTFRVNVHVVIITITDDNKKSQKVW